MKNAATFISILIASLFISLIVGLFTAKHLSDDESLHKPPVGEYGNIRTYSLPAECLGTISLLEDCKRALSTH